MRITKANKTAFENTMKRLYAWSDNQTIIEMGSSTDFIVEAFEQNLEHARHVENERVTYCSCFTALVGGGLAVMSGIENNIICLLLALLLFVVSILSTLLSERWNNAFDCHMRYAKGCYYILHCTACLDRRGAENREEDLYKLQTETDRLHKAQFGEIFQEELEKLGGTEKDAAYQSCKELFSLDGCGPEGRPLQLATLPLYAFGINNPMSKSLFSEGYDVHTTGTKKYFRLYYFLVVLLTLGLTVYYLFAVLHGLF